MHRGGNWNNDTRTGVFAFNGNNGNANNNKRFSPGGRGVALRHTKKYKDFYLGWAKFTDLAEGFMSKKFNSFDNKEYYHKHIKELYIV